MTNRKVHLGIVGAGFIGQLAHLMNYVEIPGCQVSGLAEIRSNLRDRVGSRYNIPNLYKTHNELLENKEIDAIVVVTPRNTTGPIALDCLNSNKHLLTEKPMASTLEQSERLLTAANNNNLIYKIGYMKRYDAGVQKSKKILNELLRTNELGKINFCRISCFGGNAYSKCDGHIVTDEPLVTDHPTWLKAPEWLPASKIDLYHEYLNTYCHDINLMRFYLGEPNKINYVSLKNRSGRIVEFDYNNHITVLETGFSSTYDWDEKFEIFFDHGKLIIKMPPPLLRNVPANIVLYRDNQHHSVENIISSWSWSFRRQAQAFIQDIISNTTTLTSAKDALKDIKIVEDIWKFGH